MANKKEVVPGLYAADVKAISDQIFGRNDGNCPQFRKVNKKFIDILESGKPNISASPIFIKKVIA